MNFQEKFEKRELVKRKLIKEKYDTIDIIGSQDYLKARLFQSMARGILQKKSESKVRSLSNYDITYSIKQKIKIRQ